MSRPKEGSYQVYNLNELILCDIYSPPQDTSSCLHHNYNTVLTTLVHQSSLQPHLLRDPTAGTTAATKFVTDRNVNINHQTMSVYTSAKWKYLPWPGIKHGTSRLKDECASSRLKEELLVRFTAWTNLYFMTKQKIIGCIWKSLPTFNSFCLIGTQMTF